MTETYNEVEMAITDEQKRLLVKHWLSTHVDKASFTLIAELADDLTLEAFMYGVFDIIVNAAVVQIVADEVAKDEGKAEYVNG